MTEPLKINEYDLLILGGGINGSMLYRIATDSSKKVILIEKNDYSSGTSQASGMMIWGGILYLKNLEFNLVRKFCRARDNLIKHSNQVYTRRINFTFLKNGKRSLFIMRLSLALYRLLGLLNRSATKSTSNTNLPSQWDKFRFNGGLSYEEGFLKNSDSQFTISWLFRNSNSNSKSYNYSTVRRIKWIGLEKHFEIEYSDANKKLHTIYAKKIINTCGVWADSVNEKYGIKTKASHHLSKGVYLLLNNINQKDAFAVDMEEHGDTLCWVPWGKTIMWGPTETTINSIEELPVTKEDVQFLLDKLNSKLEKKMGFGDIINVRTGIRPLVKLNNKKVKYSLELSRKAILESDKNVPWHTVFGGKLSGGLEFSNKVYSSIFKENPSQIQYNSTIDAPTTTEFFNGMELPDVEWSVKHTHVRSLEDYLRRRTNISQWIPIGGLGFKNEHLDDIKKISSLIHSTVDEANYDFQKYYNIQKQERCKWEN